MRILLKYHLRLGDVIQCFPAAKLLHDQGHEVFIECNREYHSIFEAVDYVRPAFPGLPLQVDRRLDLQVWPHAYEDYRRSGMRFREFVYGRFLELSGAVWPIEFTRTDFDLSSYNLPERFALVAGTGYSQVTKIPHAWLEAQVKVVAGDLPVFWLMEDLTVPNLAHLVALIQRADIFLTINTSCTHIAESVRSEYYHVVEPAFDYQDDLWSRKQIRLYPPCF